MADRFRRFPGHAWWNAPSSRDRFGAIIAIAFACQKQHATRRAECRNARAATLSRHVSRLLLVPRCDSDSGTVVMLLLLWLVAQTSRGVAAAMRLVPVLRCGSERVGAGASM